jgi:hypothetical protein
MPSGSSASPRCKLARMPLLFACHTLPSHSSMRPQHAAHLITAPQDQETERVVVQHAVWQQRLAGLQTDIDTAAVCASQMPTCCPTT